MGQPNPWTTLVRGEIKVVRHNDGAVGIAHVVDAMRRAV